MTANLKGRSFLTLKDYSREEICYLLDLSDKLKARKRAGIRGELLHRRNIALIFDKTSTRTRCAFDVAIWDEGGNATFLTNSQMGKKESLEDTAKVLGRYYDGIQFRGFSQRTAEILARDSGVPVWNGLTDEDHPTQVLADLMTMRETSGGDLAGKILLYAGDGRNNMSNALLIGCAKMGITYRILSPQELWPRKDLIDEMRPVCEGSGAKIELYSIADKQTALEGVDYVYADVWVSMGEEDKLEERIRLLEPYRVTEEFFRLSGKDSTIFLHCLPANHDTETEMGRDAFEKYGVREMEVSDAVFRGPRSRVFDQAENRMHTIKAIMVATIGEAEKI
jgi:ornithine carbamoyltransferase